MSVSAINTPPVPQRTPEAAEVKKGGRDNDGDADDGDSGKVQPPPAPAPAVNMNGQTVGQIINVKA